MKTHHTSKSCDVCQPTQLMDHAFEFLAIIYPSNHALVNLKTITIIYVCVCVCVCERERERERFKI